MTCVVSSPAGLFQHCFVSDLFVAGFAQTPGALRACTKITLPLYVVIFVAGLI
jgi:hypothetical protein